jgi:pimeloyl-ACP methyl ester carboxylesterase
MTLLDGSKPVTPPTRGGPARTITRRSGKALLGLVLVLALLAGLGAVYQAVATSRAQRAQPAPGVMVDVGGHRLHLACIGEGSPTVILDAALGNMSAHWAWVQQEVMRTTRVCAYDRAGLGWSDPGPGPRDAAHITSELHTLLGNAGIPGPYVMVGHSFGGLYTQLYAARYADEVAGVVLVESSHPQQFTRLPDGPQNYEMARRLYTIAPVLARLGAVRLFGLSEPPPDLPAAQRARIEAWAGSTRHIATTAEEFQAAPDTMAQAGAVHGLGNLPLAVVSAGEQSPGWLALQNELAALSTNSSHHVVDGANHTSVVDDPSHALVTSAAIADVVEAVRTNRPLTR